MHQRYGSGSTPLCYDEGRKAEGCLLERDAKLAITQIDILPQTVRAPQTVLGKVKTIVVHVEAIFMTIDVVILGLNVLVPVVIGFT